MPTRQPNEAVILTRRFATAPASMSLNDPLSNHVGWIDVDVTDDNMKGVMLVAAVGNAPERVRVARIRQIDSEDTDAQEVCVIVHPGHVPVRDLHDDLRPTSDDLQAIGTEHDPGPGEAEEKERQEYHARTPKRTNKAKVMLILPACMRDTNKLAEKNNTTSATTPAIAHPWIALFPGRGDDRPLDGLGPTKSKRERRGSTVAHRLGPETVGALDGLCGVRLGVGRGIDILAARRTGPPREGQDARVEQCGQFTRTDMEPPFGPGSFVRPHFAVVTCAPGRRASCPDPTWTPVPVRRVMPRFGRDVRRVGRSLTTSAPSGCPEFDRRIRQEDDTRRRKLSERGHSSERNEATIASGRGFSRPVHGPLRCGGPPSMVAAKDGER